MEKSFVKSQSSFVSKTLLTMAFGLLITFVIAFVTPMFLNEINPIIMLAALIGEVILVVYLTAKIRKMSTTTARMWFCVYAALNGFTLSIILAQYNLHLVTTVFLLTSAMFFCSAMVGVTAKRDLSAFGQFFIMLLIGLLMLSLMQMFFRLAGLSFLISLLGIITFCGLTAYDMQKIKRFHADYYYISPEEVQKYSIISALGLYLDFINLFIYVLRLFKDN